MLNLNLQEILGQDDVMSAMNDLRSMQTVGPDSTSLLDLDAYRVNPFKGYIAENGVLVGAPPQGSPTNAPGILPVDIITEMGGDTASYLKYRNMVSKHETGGTFDPKQKQDGGGPGRGLFQFEQEAMETAATRLDSYFKKADKVPPAFIRQIKEGKIKDASVLSPQDQEMLFVGQMLRQDKDKNTYLRDAFKKPFNNVDEVAQAWFEVHNRSGADKKQVRIDKFKEDNQGLFDTAETLLDLSPVSIPMKPGVTNPPGAQAAAPPFPISGKVPEAGLGDFFKKAGKTLGQGAKGLGDFVLSNIGMGDVIQNSFVDNNKALSTYTGVMGKMVPAALNLVAPGVGTALSGVGSSVNQMANQNQQPQMQPMNVGHAFGGGQSPFGGGMDTGNMMALMQLMPLLMGNGQQQGGMGGLMSLLGGGFTGQSFENGGIVDRKSTVRPTYKSASTLHLPETPGIITTGDRAPIQAEKYRGRIERVILPTGHVSESNAVTQHKYMEDDEITDIVVDGTYVASAQPKMAIDKKMFADINLGYQEQLYVEGQANKMPRMFTAAEVIPDRHKGKKVIPTDYADMVAKHFPLADDTDIFTQAANMANLRARIPYLATLVSLGMDKKEEVETMSNGGIVKKAPLGDFINIAATALPFITQAAQSFNGNPSNGFGANGLDPMNDAMMLGSIPLGQIGINKNFNAQNDALTAARAGQSQLTAEQQRLNNQGTAIGVMTALGQETDLERLTQDYSRLQNFNTSTPQQFINAAAAPVQDMRAMIDALGPKAAVSALANQNSQSVAVRNQAAAQAFQTKQAQDMQIAQYITQGRNAQEQYNNQLSQQELALRNNQMAAVGGQLQGNTQNASRILADDFRNSTQLSLQQAGLQGQKEAATAQQLMNMASMRQAFLNQGTGGIGGRGQGQVPQQQYASAEFVNQAAQGMSPSFTIGQQQPFSGGLQGTAEGMLPINTGFQVPSFGYDLPRFGVPIAPPAATQIPGLGLPSQVFSNGPQLPQLPFLTVRPT